MEWAARGRGRGRTRLNAFIVALVSGVALALPGGASAALPCHVGNLQLVYRNHLTNGPTTFWNFALRNARAIECELHGYPTARLLNAHGHPLPAAGAQVGRQLNLPTPRVVLAHAASAYFTFLFNRSHTCPHAHHVSFFIVEFEYPSALFFPRSDHPQQHSICSGTARVSPFRGHP